MTPQQIDKLKSLDKEGCDGSIQQVLLRSDLSKVPTGMLAFTLLSA